VIFVEKGQVREKSKTVDIFQESATIKENTASSEETAVTTIGKIDIERYKCVTSNITTDEVIITDERIAHIKNRHPGDYERFCSYLPQIVSDPDFIMRDKRPNTAMILKEIDEEGERFRLALRLVTPEDHNDYKNSILTFLKIHEKEWNRLVKNKEILYRKE